MKILIISQYWAPENGVPQRRWTWLSRILVDAGHEVTVIAPPPHYERRMSIRSWFAERKAFLYDEPQPGFECGPSGERIVRSGFIPAGRSLTQRVLNQATVALGGLWTVIRRKGELRGYSPDIIIGTVPALPTAGVTAIAAKIFCTPYIIDLRDAWPDLLQESSRWNKGTGKTSVREHILSKGPLQVLAAATEKMLNASLRGATALVVTSSELEADLKVRGHIRKRGKPLLSAVVRNVFPPETPYTAQGPRSATENELNVLYAGTLGRAQNLTNAIRAAELASDNGVTVNLRFVGAGAARDELTRLAAESPVDISIVPRHPADALDKHYEWADTALVHLTDWPALKHAVPSKTYELMNVGLHITAVVEGEAASIVRRFEAGHVVAPEDPHALAQLWANLARDHQLLKVPATGAQWVQEERDNVAPQRFLEIVEDAVL